MLTGEDGVVVRYGEADARSRGYQWLPVQPGRAGVDGEEVAVVGHEVAVVRPQRDAEQLPPNGCGGLPRRGGVEVEAEPFRVDVELHPADAAGGEHNPGQGRDADLLAVDEHQGRLPVDARAGAVGEI